MTHAKRESSSRRRNVIMAKDKKGMRLNVRKMRNGRWAPYVNAARSSISKDN